MPAARHPPPALCRERLLSARYAGAIQSFRAGVPGVPPLTPTKAHSQEWLLPARRARAGAGWPCGLSRVLRVSASAPGPQFPPWTATGAPPALSPPLPPGAAGRSGSRGAGAPGPSQRR